MNTTSELMMGGEEIVVDGRWTLHIKNRGTKRVRARESVSSLLADHIKRLGKEQTYLPMKSPTLKTRKWVALKRRGCVLGLVGCTEVVIGG